MINYSSRYRMVAKGLLFFCWGASLSLAHAEEGTDQSQVDPHVYAYTAEFAKTFGMPEAWISEELTGVDAVAYRVMPTYKSCGWAGKLDTCFTHNTRCELDLYFDQRRNPLYWDERHPRSESSTEGYSSNFISSRTRHRSPIRRGEHHIVRVSPLMDSAQGGGVTWRYRYSTRKGRGSGFSFISGYERNAFDQVDRVTLNIWCFDELNHLDLVTEEFLMSKKNERLGVVKTLELPDIWNRRRELAGKKKERRLDIFLREEGEDVLRKLRAKPIRDVPIFTVN